MWTWIKLGGRNLLKNKRRSAFTVGAVALGFAAVNVFGGFTAYVYRGIEDGFIYAHANGHLTIFKKGFLEEGALDPASFLLSEEDLARIHEVCMEDPRVVLATPQLRISGMISNGKSSVIFLGVGRVPSDEIAIRRRAGGFVKLLRPFDGQELRDDTKQDVSAAPGLAEKLGLGLGSDAIVFAPTIDGQMNALDAHIVQLVDSPDEVLADKILIVPLEFARSLYDTTGADRMTVLIEHTRDTAAVREALDVRLAAAGLDVEIKTWQELRVSYFKIRNMFDVIFIFIFVIVFIIVLLSVVNTVGMAVVERTREIGTMRSLGLKRRGVLIMFAAESAVMALVGCVLGLALTLLAVFALDLAGPTWIPPTITRRVPLQVYLVPEYLLLSLLCLILLAMCTAVVPARRAARIDIVDALGHV
ncbi:MAG: ABC transporter permease [Lentisphaerae bacterium]|nr:ABC transporter permease [Lentisphaerota bacterium]